VYELYSNNRGPVKWKDSRNTIQGESNILLHIDIEVRMSGNRPGLETQLYRADNDENCVSETLQIERKLRNILKHQLTR
jgi:hypothetical protein